MRLTTLKTGLTVHRPQLATLTPGSWRSGKENSAARGYGYRWQKAREGFLRDNPLCCYCERDGRPLTPATVVDHKIPHRGDQALFWDQSNWQPLCKTCHDTLKKIEEKQG